MSAKKDAEKSWVDAWALHNAKIVDLENSKKYLDEELTATKRALLGKESKIEELLSTVAHLEGKLRVVQRSSDDNREDVLKALRLIKSAFDIGENNEFKLWWGSAFAFIGEAIAHKRTIEHISEIYNKTILKHEAQLKEATQTRAEMSAQISGLNDEIDALKFEMDHCKRDRDEAVARSQRQAARITDMEMEVCSWKTEAERRKKEAEKYQLETSKLNTKLISIRNSVDSIKDSLK